MGLIKNKRLSCVYTSVLSRVERMLSMEVCIYTVISKAGCAQEDVRVG